MDIDPVTALSANLDALPLDVRLSVESGADDGFVQLHSTGPQLSASVRTPDGRRVRIHSGRDPVTEADRYLDGVLAGSVTPVVIVISPGLGYVVEAIERRAPGTRFIAIEPFPSVARAMLERRDWREWIRSGRLTFLLGREYLGASDAWKLLDDRAPSTTIIEHPVIGREFPAEIARARGLAAHIVKGAQSNADARKKFAGRYLLNTLRNLPALVAEGDAASLVDLFPGVPAIIVAAGPSLDDNIQHVRALDGRALVIAVDTALRPLRAAGIQPHVVVAVDPSERNAIHLIGVTDSGGSWLVSEGSVDPGVFPEFAGRAFGFKVSEHHPWPWLRTLGFERGTLRAWGSVVTTAFDLACRLGCDPIVFVGADLSYTGGLHYCRSTIHEGAADTLATAETRIEAFAGWMREHERPTCTETDLRGAHVVSTPDFLQFRDWLVSRAVAVRPRRVLNATGAGILHGDGIVQVDLARMSFSRQAGGTDDFRERLGAAWTRSTEGRDSFAERLEGAVGTPDSGGVPMEAWLDFAGDTASSAQIRGGLEAAWNAIEKTYRQAPVITEQSAGYFWTDGWTVRFTAAASGGPPPTVQWQESHDGGSSWSDIIDATATTYACIPAAIGHRFRAVFTNVFGSATTNPGALTVTGKGVIADFNGDHRPDVLWRDGITGANVIWYLDGVTRTGVGELVAVPDTRWTLAGAGDFSGDGRPDVLWRHSATGENVFWHLDGLNRVGWRVLDMEADLAWTVVGTGDFNGDGRSDILWRHLLTGANRVWYMDGATRTGVGVLDTEADLTWTIVGTGDFNGDGKPDILWRNTVTGANVVWYMEGVTLTGIGVLDAEADLTWTVVGTGDFNGDGKVDILWLNTVTGANLIWYMDGVTKTGLGVPDTASDAILVTSAEEHARRRAAVT